MERGATSERLGRKRFQTVRVGRKLDLAKGFATVKRAVTEFAKRRRKTDRG